MKKILWLLMMGLAMVCAAYAEGDGSTYERTVQVHEDCPPCLVRVSDTGEDSGDPLMPDHILLVEIFTQEGELLQAFSYESGLTPEYPGAAALVMSRDLNFDGYQDLMLMTNAGARNVFHAISIWDSRTNRFRPVEQAYRWNRESRRWSEERTQLELCNVECFPEQQMLLSEEEDGFRYSRSVYAMWDGGGLEPRYIWDVYDAGKGMIGESLTGFVPQVTFYWDEQYPEEWYYGEDDVTDERRQAICDLALKLASDHRYLRVANVDWVNLRKQNSKQSPSLAKLNRGTEVMKLHDATGDSDGWVRVWMSPLSQEEKGLTGYIWAGFLEPVPEERKPSSASEPFSAR